MLKQINAAYLYDGSYYGMLCCVFESFSAKELPLEIVSDGITLFPVKEIATDIDKAERVENGIINKISGDALNYVRLAYLCSYKDKEIAVIRFLRAGFKYGKRVADMLTHEDVMPIAKAVKLISTEKVRWIEFIRFSEYDKVLISIIEPENRVLPLIVSHFTNRFPNERFMVYDRTHKEALIYEKKQADIIPLIDFELPEADGEEQKYRKLWRMFYDNIAIEERRNERCRMNFMPKKYWKRMTEFTTD